MIRVIFVIIALVLGHACSPGADTEPGAGGAPGCTALDPPTWFADQDGDGLGDAETVFEGCSPPEGYVPVAGDPAPHCATNDVDECGMCGGPGRRAFFLDADEDGLGDPYRAEVGCAPPEGYVANADDQEPDCATNDTDPCGECGGPGGDIYYPDQDDDGMGDRTMPTPLCAPMAGYVENNQDLDPLCATNDTDECGVCAGAGAAVFYADQDGDGQGDPEVFFAACEAPPGFVNNPDDTDPRCATDDTDGCGVCAGEELDRDCVGVCFGEGYLDGCGRCVGGTTGRTPFLADRNQNDIPDACDRCPAEPTARAVFQWTAVHGFGEAGVSGPYTFQVHLYGNGDFAYQYAVVEPFGATVSVGHQGPGGRNAVSLGVDTDFVRDHPMVLFRARGDGRVEHDIAAQPNWLDIRHSGAPLRFVDADAVEVPLGFEFPYDGARYDRVRVGADGVIVLSGPLPSPQNGPLGVPELGAFLAPFWDDLEPAASGTITYFEQGAECDLDCAGMYGGVAVIDACEVCVGGTSPRDPLAHVDCSGVCHGEAFVDACGACVGGDTGIEPADPADCAQAPDLVVDGDYLRETIVLDSINADDQCLINERCLQGLGLRQLLRFGTRIANLGNADLQLGRPVDDNELWNFDQCHGHFHFQGYAAYDLYDVEADRMLPIGAKNGFAVVDLGVYDPHLAPQGCRGYGGQNQGITVGCQDTYSRNLQCQWIDITEVPDGLYELVVQTNPDRLIEELDYTNNEARVRLRLEAGGIQLVP